MKLLQNAAIGVCLFTSITVQAQETSPTVEKNKDTILQSESKEKEYKSKEWKQGNEAITDTTTISDEKRTLHMKKKGNKQPATPPPPPLATPPAPPPPPAKD
ncbi:hypothetical protein [Segetibacter koreensis]|uniref:hypothetical protein n=1 Tax=Segetibacter koreensis TaxID=398037 RepID=UPI0003712AB3|nr:hypothetical protein [Segetibacter koreensis]